MFISRHFERVFLLLRPSMGLRVDGYARVVPFLSLSLTSGNTSGRTRVYFLSFMGRRRRSLWNISRLI